MSAMNVEIDSNKMTNTNSTVNINANSIKSTANYETPKEKNDINVDIEMIDAMESSDSENNEMYDPILMKTQTKKSDLENDDMHDVNMKNETNNNETSKETNESDSENDDMYNAK